jgi:hypothetical protein
MTPDTEPFQIMKLHADSPEVIEQLGSKRKFWFRLQGDEQPWLFKYTRENTGEDWSEKIASELAKLLDIRAAQVELATFLGKRGCASRSFVETKKGFELIHGSEVMAGRVFEYEKKTVGAERSLYRKYHCSRWSGFPSIPTNSKFTHLGGLYRP